MPGGDGGSDDDEAVVEDAVLASWLDKEPSESEKPAKRDYSAYENELPNK